SLRRCSTRARRVWNKSRLSSRRSGRPGVPVRGPKDWRRARRILPGCRRTRRSRGRPSCLAAMGK
ncbi:MAG: hypothetical protein ACK55Z_31430, partial [bacterium]